MDTLGLLSEAPSLGIAVDGTIRADPSAIVDRIRAVKEAWTAQRASYPQRTGLYGGALGLVSVSTLVSA